MLPARDTEVANGKQPTWPQDIKGYRDVEDPNSCTALRGLLEVDCTGAHQEVRTVEQLHKYL